VPLLFIGFTAMHAMDLKNNNLVETVASTDNSSTKKGKNGKEIDGSLRQGKWTREEEVRDRLGRCF
jgi:hypothetical protein